jgi:RNA polymerase sigma-70 factor (ECF subfamily)
MSDDRTIDLMARWQQGDQDAAASLFDRFAHRLIALARSRLSSQFGPRFDAEDVVQSAYRSFFAGAREGRYDAHRGGDIWQLLVVITLHKLRQQVRRNQAAKRSVHKERYLETDGNAENGIEADLYDREPSPIEALALIDEVEQTLRKLDPTERKVLELRLQGYNLEEIAQATDRSERTVRRVLDRVRERLEADGLAPPPG